jgi:threonine dehydrogenase-like Zn-dependent dehydrogenase
LSLTRADYFILTTGGSDLHNYVLGAQIVLDQTKPSNGKPEPLTYGHELCGRVKNPPPGSRFTGGEAVMVDPRSVALAVIIITHELTTA